MRDEQDRASAIPRRDPAPALEAREHVLDHVALAIARNIVGNLDLAAKPCQDAQGNSQFDQCVAVPIGIVSAGRQQGNSCGIEDSNAYAPTQSEVARRKKDMDRTALSLGQHAKSKFSPP